MLAIVILACYLAAALWLVASVYRATPEQAHGRRVAGLGTSFVALLTHAIALWLSLSSQTAALTLAETASLVGFILALVAAIACLRQPRFAGTSAVLLVIAGIVGAATDKGAQAFVATQQGGWELNAHIALSVLAYAFVTVGAAFAIAMTLLDHRLRRRQALGWLSILPSLEALESALFQAIGAGFATLSLALFSGFFFIQNLREQHLTHKVILSCLSWIILGILLLGRWRFGWRGRTALYWTLGGFVVLGLAYFGNKLVLETFLGQALGMSDLSTATLVALVIILILLSAFFAATETALMSLNRYRLRHQSQAGSRSARLTEQLLSRPDRLIGIILLGNTFANFGAAAVTSLIAFRLWGDTGISFAVGTVAVAILMFIFGDLAPKTYGAIHPERLALPSAWIYSVLVRLLYPLVWAANLVANALLKLLGVSREQAASHSLSADELRTVVAEASVMIPRRHQNMLINILDLEKIEVDDIMVPRNEIAGIDALADWDDILEGLRSSSHTRIPVYEGSLDKIVGILHLKRVAQALARGELEKDHLIELARSREPYFVPSGTTLNTQLLNFQHLRRRSALIVNEYGDILGLITLEDLLEEIVGEFTTDTGLLHRDIHREADGSYVVNGSINVRTLNRRLGWSLPTDGPRTLNGMILEYLEDIPDVGTALKIGDQSFEILQIADNTIKTVRIRIANEKPAKSKGAA